MKNSNQLMGQLPNKRTAVFDPVFTNAGVDYFGPILVKSSKRTRFTSGQDKRYGTHTNYNINWKFIPPLSTWMGGAWESIVKLTKRALRIVTHDRPMYEDSLSTFTTEIESVLNSGPLTSVTDDPNDYNVLNRIILYYWEDNHYHLH